MTPTTESIYDQITFQNVLGEDFEWQMGYDSNNEPIVFLLPEGEQMTMQRNAANHAIKKMTMKCIAKFEWHEKEKRNGEMVKQYGGVLTLDPSLHEKWRNKIIVGVKSAAIKKEKNFGEQVRDQLQSIIGNTGSDDAFANLNQSNGGDEVSKWSFPKLKKVAHAFGIDTNVKGKTQDKLREEVRAKMLEEE